MDASKAGFALGICFRSIFSIVIQSSALQESHFNKQVLILASYHPGMNGKNSMNLEIKLHFAIDLASAALRWQRK